MELEKSKRIDFTYLTLLVLGSCSYLITKDYSAFDWPTSDMFNFFLKINDPSLLINDLYTNSLTEDPNPRWVYGKIILFLSGLFNNDWFYVIWILKVLITIFLPVLLYILLTSILYKFDKNHHNLKKTLLFLSLFMLVTFQNIVPRLFAIAWWVSFYIQPNPQNISWICGICFLIFDIKNQKYYSSVFLFLCTVIHPTVGCISLIIISLIRNEEIFNLKNFLTYLIVFIISILILVIGFKNENILSNSRFVEIYSFENHPQHYNLHQFGTFFNLDNKFLILLICALYTIPLFYFFNKNISFFRFGFFGLLFFLFSILIQFIFTNVYPNKLINSLGLIRYSFVNYFLISILWSQFLSQFFNNRFFSVVKSSRLKFQILLLFLISVLTLNPPSLDSDLDNFDKEMIKFIKSNTKKNDVFGTVYKIKYIDIIAKRSVFTGNGFPFNEKYFEIHQKKRELFFGKNMNINKNSENLDLQKRFARLTPTNFKKISDKFKLDYIILDKENINSEFLNFLPVYENMRVKIFKVSDFSI